MLKKIILTIFVVIIGSSIFFYFHSKIDIMIVDIISPSVRDIKTEVRVPGQVVNNGTVTLGAPLNSQIQSIPVKIGDRVHKGQVLVNLNNQIQSAQFNETLLQIKSDRFNLKLQKHKLAKLIRLSKSGAIPKDDLVNAQARFDSIKHELDMSLQKSKIAAITLSNTKVTAPYDGIVVDIHSVPGQWTIMGGRLLTIAPVGGKKIIANIDINELKHIKKGMVVYIESDSISDKSWNEKVLRVSPIVESSSKLDNNSFKVTISLTNFERRLLLNQQLDVIVPTEIRKNVLSLPHHVILNSKNKSKVATIEVMKKNPYYKQVLQKIGCELELCLPKNANIIKLINIDTGIEDLTHIEITSNLNKTQPIVIPNGIALKNGIEVKTILVK